MPDGIPERMRLDVCTAAFEAKLISRFAYQICCSLSDIAATVWVVDG